MDFKIWNRVVLDAAVENTYNKTIVFLSGQGDNQNYKSKTKTLENIDIFNSANLRGILPGVAYLFQERYRKLCELGLESLQQK